MPSFLRGEEMELVQLIIPKETAYECVGELGRIGVVQFNDLNQTKSIIQRYFIRDTRRCEEIVRKLRYLKHQIVEFLPKISMKSAPSSDLSMPTLQEINQLEIKLDELERDLVLMSENGKKLQKNYNEMNEFKHVLERVENFFEIHIEDEAMHEIESINNYDVETPFVKSFNSYGTNNVPLTPLLTPGAEAHGDNAWFIAGVIPKDKRNVFERVLWRACRRTAFVRISDISFEVTDPVSQDKIEKVVFIIFFKGESLRQIIDKVCDGFNAHQYPCPKTSKERQDALFDVIGRIQDHGVIIDSTTRQRHDILSVIAEDLPGWMQKVHMHKANYHTLNMCTVDTNGFLAAECWIPKTEQERVYSALQDGLKNSGSDVAPVMNVVETTATPPTFNRCNKFTGVFQSIVNSYGIARYREVNPAPFIIITFPFLFGVMFGDAAHGTILFLIGLAFYFYEDTIIAKRVQGEIFNTFFGGRYIIIMMGLFSIYTGFLYNDAFGKSFNIFGSRWLYPYNASEPELLSGEDVHFVPQDHYHNESGPYPFGVDPIWNIAENRLSFINSLKMKMSVILGVGQMTFGVFLSLLNHWYFKSPNDIFTNFIPQLIFLSCIFIYLCVQIVLKWLFFTAGPSIIFGQKYPGSHCAPSLLIGLINSFMWKKRVHGWHDEDDNEYYNCHLNFWYPNQAYYEAVLMSIAFACVPIMLLGKPLHAWCKSRKRKPAKTAEELILMENGKAAAAPGGEHHEALGEVVVHQAIHTIEFCLGCVSHTASYLRLWALSLAHALSGDPAPILSLPELSEVLWHMVLIRGMQLFDDSPILGPIFTYIIFTMFAVLTLCILVMMEGLSAFLHALRLHWVEFQSKFYQGTGKAFQPYSLQDAAEAAEEHIVSLDDTL